ncbi:MAG: hypothetical protein J6E46_13365 [Faecalicoccus sp.]|nr:hypothetical protein [Faecalicoccus sp.]
MRKLLAFILSLAMILTGCSSPANQTQNDESSDTTVESNPSDTEKETEINFSDLNDPKLLQYVEDQVYTELVSEFDSEDYFIENVNTTYISKELVEELTYNSKSNVFFGYTLAELDAQFKDHKYVFTMGDNGETIVKPMEGYDDTFDKVIKNVAIGTGVILVCVTVSVVSGAAGFVPVSIFFAASAKTATTFALKSSVFGAISAGVVEGIKTGGDMDAMLKAAALGGGEGLKWGAISGAIYGGATELSAFHRTANAVEGGTEVAKGTVKIPEDAPEWVKAQYRALNEIGGYEQLSYLNGKQVPYGTKGATRPDIIQNLIDHINAVDVKYYDLENPSSLNTLYRELKREVSSRIKHLPAGSTQEIVLDVTGRGFSEATCEGVKKEIWRLLEDIYPNIPIRIVGLS